MEAPNALKGIWITASELGRHIGYINPSKNVKALFNKHTEAFEEGKHYTRVTLRVGNQEYNNVLIFSELGALRLLAFCKKPVALTLIEEVHEIYLAVKRGAFPSSIEMEAIPRSLKIQTYTAFARALELQGECVSALIVRAHAAEIVGLYMARAFLPRLECDYLTPKEMAKELGTSPQQVGKLLQKINRHAKQDPTNVWSEPYKGGYDNGHGWQETTGYRYKPFVLDELKNHIRRIKNAKKTK